MYFFQSISSLILSIYRAITMVAGEALIGSRSEEKAAEEEEVRNRLRCGNSFYEISKDFKVL